MSIPVFNVSNLDGSNGFRLDGANSYSLSGIQDGSLGDINGDGFSDVTVDAQYARGLGVSYVVFGQAAGFSATKDLSSLDGHDGFRVHGMATYGSSGIFIANGGDINGDGIEDMIVSESATTFSNERLSHTYVVFGKTAGFEEDIDLTSLDGEDGFGLQGAPGSFDRIERAGDINGDGFADVIASSVTIDSIGQTSGFSTVVFGRASGFDPVVDLTSLDGQNGFLFGETAGGQSAYAVHAAGDVNGDGLADVIVGDPKADPHGDDSGSTYVVFGKTSGFDAVLDLSSLDGQTGFRLDGEEERYSSRGVASVGDINGDGFDDVVIDAPGANKTPYGYSYYMGARYIVFGKASGFDAHMDLSSLDGNNGFRLNGPEHMRGISSAGDINGDGLDDIFIESKLFSRYASYDTGYVVFGKASGFDAAMDIGDLDGRNGFQMTFGGFYTDTSFNNAGDVNGDGFDDLIAGVREASYSGVSYLVLGRASGFPAMLSSSDDSIGVRLEQELAGQLFGASVSAAGDVNGDGFDDVIVSAPWADPNGEKSGSSYVIFGRSNFQSDQTIRGTPGDDNLTGTTGEDRFEAGDGNDSMTGLGGADTFLAGNGDDVLKVTDMDFHLADGGGGQDTLELTGNGFDLNLADFSDRINQIETIDLTGNGDNTLTFSLADFLDVAGSPNTLVNSLTVKGNEGDRVRVLDGNWSDGGTDQNYRIFMHSGATLRVDRSIDIDIVAGQGMFDLGTLDGDNGFLLDSTFIPASGDSVGYSVSSAGDINGDGFDDVIIGSPNTYIDHRDFFSYFVVLGKASGFDAQMDLSKLDGSNGFRLDRAKDGFGGTVSNAGDVNGDGFDDVIIGASYYDSNSQSKSGSSYVVLGKASGFDAQMDLSKLDGSNGFRLVDTAYAGSGMPVSSAGDINGDGFDDVILGSPFDAFSSGSSYVVFGRASGFDASMNLSSLNGSDGFRLDGEASDRSGVSVSGAGDVNGDGFDDVIVGASEADHNGDRSGSSYVVFGKASGFDASMNLSSLNGNNGFRLDGVAKDDFSGELVSGAGDVNGDGFDDVIVSATGADPNGDNSGSSYVVFGRASGFAAQMDLSSLDGGNGFRLDGAVRGDGSGISVSGAGDVNGDGYNDVIIGAAVSGPFPQSGSSYVVFGKASGFDATLNLDVLDGNNGFRVDGKSELDILGRSVSSAGDVNGDGFDDLLIGAPGANPNGTSYIIFGSADLGKGNGGGELPEIKGTDGDDTLKGTTAAELFKAGDGNDKMIGRGGADEFHGEDGNDFIQVLDLGFGLVDGGAGNDVLHLDGKDLNLDLTNYLDHIQSIETICLYGRGDNTLSLTGAELKELSDTTDTLRLHGNAGDQVILEGEWADGGSHGFYHTYTQDYAVVLVGMNMTAVIA